jgi:hypothetical protein
MELNHRNIIKCKAASERGSASQEYENLRSTFIVVIQNLLKRAARGRAALP